VSSENDLNKRIYKAYSNIHNSSQRPHNDPSKGDNGSSKKTVKDASIHDTSGGEMPDPNKMPSKTKFHLDIKENI
jgi:hypothetical protein